jgi:hypothetical protein
MVNYSPLGIFAPFTQAATQATQRVAGGVGELFGIKDPVLERNRILANLDTSDPTSLRAAAQALMAQGDVDAGMQLAAQARQVEQQERTFGLQERQTRTAEKRAETEKELGRKRLELSESEIKAKLEDLSLRRDLTSAQIEKIRAEIGTLGKGDYSIREQKGPGQETVAFVAINTKPPFDQRIIPVSGGVAAPMKEPEEAKATTRRGDRRPLGTFAGEPR